MTVFVPVGYFTGFHYLYVSIMIENLRRLGEYELLQGKISIHLFKGRFRKFYYLSVRSARLAVGTNLLLQQEDCSVCLSYSYNQWIKDMRSGKKDGDFPYYQKERIYNFL